VLIAAGANVDAKDDVSLYWVMDACDPKFRILPLLHFLAVGYIYAG